MNRIVYFTEEADPRCPDCHGTGYVTDRVPCGDTTASFDAPCDCVCQVLCEDEETIDLQAIERRIDGALAPAERP